ncbi:hypothetical protein CC80DRAFT_574868 [Byssothecium circinans]|uniref:Uncharacterized protein n=1 Tax=Byssothecium circinans TaxID=147558 RepID=A0A6A5TKX2_9PLEO|nr:hypothetical protein CC80DRAFT_574868 [Byssothecium circinans]
MWDWVNGAANNSFVMVAGPGDCGNNTDRIPFTVTRLAYDEEAPRADFTISRQDWTATAHSYDLEFGSITKARPTRRNKRDIIKSSSINFNHKFAGSIPLKKDNLEGKVSCDDWNTVGEFNMQFVIKQRYHVPKGASMQFSPRGVSAIAKFRLEGSGSIKDVFAKTFNILSIPLEDGKIPKIFDLGPFLTVAVGAQIFTMSLTANITTGATSELSHDAIVVMDLLSPKNNESSGWKPTIDFHGVTVDGSTSGAVALFLQPALELKAKVLASLEACKDKPGKIGVKIATSNGAALHIKAAKIGDEPKPRFTKQLAIFSKELPDKHFPIKTKRHVMHIRLIVAK